MKGHVAAAATAIATLAREGFQPAGDLVFAATADEEVGVDVGLSWLCKAHPDVIRTDYCVNEGPASGCSSAAGPSTSARPPRR